MNYKRAFVTVAVFAVASPVSAQNAQAVFTKVSPSVVVVKGKTAQGSGVAVSVRVEGTGKQTAIVTNCHVVEGNVVVRVTHQSATAVAYVRSCDAERDIAIVELRAELPIASTRSAATLKIGEPVYAIGAPRGLDLSISEGIVSQLRGGDAATRAMPLIQTTAAISPGSSGGGLFDAQGRLVGITTLYLNDAQSLNFAIPSDWIAQAVERGDIVKTERFRSGRVSPPTTQAIPERAIGTCGWLRAGKTDIFTLYIDRCAITQQGRYRLGWVLLDYQQKFYLAVTLPGGMPLVASTKDRYAVDCATQRLVATSSANYVEAMGRGEVAYANFVPEAEWSFRDVVPGSTAESIVRHFCQ